MEMDQGNEKSSNSSAKDYDEAVRMSQEIEKQMLQMMGFVTPVGLELQLATMFIACFYPAIWVIVIFFYVAVCVYGTKRGAVRDCLKKHDIAGAKTALDSAKTWNGLMILMEIVMGGIEVWGIFQLIHHIKG